MFLFNGSSLFALKFVALSVIVYSRLINIELCYSVEQTEIKECDGAPF